MWTTSCEPIFTQFQRKWTYLSSIEIKLTVSYSIAKMNIFEAKSVFSKDSLLHCEHMENYVFSHNEHI